MAEHVEYVGDEKNIRQMISLLLDNAMKYSSEQGIIRIALKTSGKNKIITVWNTTDQMESWTCFSNVFTVWTLPTIPGLGALESDFPSCMRS